MPLFVYVYGKLDETIGTSSYYVVEDYLGGPEIQ